MAELSLPRLQEWMQAVIVHPGAVEDGLASDDARRLLPPEQIESVLRPSLTLTAAERIGIYQGMYLLRMSEALESDYPGLAHLLGPEAFHQLVSDYVQAHPSRSYTLNRLGDHLPEFLAAGGGSLSRPELCADLARLELAVTEAFDAEETEALDESTIAAVPADAWPSARLLPVASFRLLSLRFPVSSWLDAIREEGEAHHHPRLKRKDSFALVYRKAYAVYREDLSRSAYELLSDLAQGHSLGESLDRAAARPRAPKPEQLFAWFAEWARGGVFQRVVLE